MLLYNEQIHLQFYSIAAIWILCLLGGNYSKEYSQQRIIRSWHKQMKNNNKPKEKNNTKTMNETNKSITN